MRSGCFPDLVQGHLYDMEPMYLANCPQTLPSRKMDEEVGVIVAYLGGMPQSAFFQFLTKLKALALRVALLWVDWDMGGLCILRYLRQHWPSHLPDLQVVPHPHACLSAAVGGYPRAGEARLGFPSPGKPQVTAVRREEVPESYLDSTDPLVAGFAADLREYGSLYQEEYQEEVLSIYRDLLPPPAVSGHGKGELCKVVVNLARGEYVRRS